MTTSLYRWIQRVRWGLGLLCALAAVWFAFAYWRLTPVPAPAPETEIDTAYHWPDPVAWEPAGWSAVQRTGGTPVTASGPLAGRFRLAGTFFAFAGGEQEGGDDARHAILDDLEQRRQRLVQEGHRIEQFEVVSIFKDRVILRGEAGDEEIFLSFGERTAPVEERADGPPSALEALRFEDMPALETSRFGKRIGENRWLFDRDEVLRYADELQDDPERMAAVLLAMQPDYNEQDEITGFELGMLGENALYEAAGFRDGDVVRMVNSMPMTSPARAQYFIRQFLTGEISALVFDIEREGEAEKLIHLIR